MSTGQDKSSEGMLLKMKKRTQEFLNAANEAAARSLKHNFKPQSTQEGRISNSSNFTDYGHANDLRESKSLGKPEESMRLNPFSQSYNYATLDEDKREKLIHGKSP